MKARAGILPLACAEPYKKGAVKPLSAFSQIISSDSVLSVSSSDLHRQSRYHERKAPELYSDGVDSDGVREAI